VSYSPNSITPTFNETSPRGNARTQIMKVGDMIGVADFHDYSRQSVGRLFRRPTTAPSAWRRVFLWRNDV